MLNSQIYLGDARAVIEIDFRPAGPSGSFGITRYYVNLNFRN